MCPKAIKEPIMKPQKCACPECICMVSDDAVIRDGKAYCSQACADHHPQGEKACADENCHCEDGRRMEL
ncbi:MAG: Prokaryotic metallothionein [Pseudomonas sp.]|nr:Prokaryotic metallothionein [Pseudomonas sp.]